jgi:predicted CopG family antitoxin
MRSINVYFEDKDFEELEEAKGKQSWRDFILSLLDRREGEAE